MSAGQARFTGKIAGPGMSVPTATVEASTFPILPFCRRRLVPVNPDKARRYLRQIQDGLLVAEAGIVAAGWRGTGKGPVIPGTGRLGPARGRAKDLAW